MAYTKCECKDNETVITAQMLNDLQDAVCAAERHALTEGNPHGTTPEQIGAAPASALTQRMYVVKGTILTSDGTARGSGTATVHITPDGIARIDYAVAITESGTVEESYSVGLDISLLRAANQNIPAITPIVGGCCAYYKTDGSLNTGKMQYGGFHATWLNNGRWSLGRVYTPDGSDGSWSDTGFIAGQTIVGTCYGQVAQ